LVGDVIAVVRCNALQPTNGYRLLFDTATTTRRLTRTITYTSENAWKYIGFTILHVCGGEIALSNHADIGGNISVGGTAPLAIDDLVEVLWV
jgi:hypothetical protein